MVQLLAVDKGLYVNPNTIVTVEVWTEGENLDVRINFVNKKFKLLRNEKAKQFLDYIEQ
jgi:hypothetical protein